MEVFLISLVSILIGALFVFAGYQFFRVLIPIWGFIAGFVWGAQLVALAFGTGFLATVVGWGFGLFLALVMAVLAYLFYQIAVGVLVAFIAYTATLGIFTAIGMNPSGFLPIMLGLTAGVLLGGAAVYYNAPKGLLILLSAFGGATAVIGGFLAMFGQIPVMALGTNIVGAIITQSFFWTIAWIVLGVAGIVSQMAMSKDVTLDTSDYYTVSAEGLTKGTKNK